jgi:uncharacterized alpha-E superfamily protein
VRRESAKAGSSPGDWAVAAERALTSAIFGDEPLETVRSAVAHAHDVAKTVRDRISQDTFRSLSQLDHDIDGFELAAAPNALAAIAELLNRAIVALAAFSGLAMDSMTHGQAWRFLDMGRRLERAVHMVSVLRHALGSPSGREGPLLEDLLEVADSSMTYRRRYLATLQLAPVADLLLTDETNPRSVLFQIATLADHLDALPHEPVVPCAEQKRLVLSALMELRLADMNELCPLDEAGARPGLSGLLDRLWAILPQVSEAISGVYLNHAVVSRQLQRD